MNLLKKSELKMEMEIGHNHIKTQRKGQKILGSFIDAISWDKTIHTIASWVSENKSRYICLCNVHSVVTAHRDKNLFSALNNSDLNLSDGMPLVWTLRLKGYASQSRINGPDLTMQLCSYAEKNKVKVFFLGSTEKTLFKLKSKLKKLFPNLDIVGMISPPFRPQNEEEILKIIDQINISRPALVFVGLGCPKQEIWMYKYKNLVSSILIGVGAAFDYHAGTLKRAPLWMQKNGLEWLYRFIKEPRRLWKRYLVTNSLFAFFMFIDLFKTSKAEATSV